MFLRDLVQALHHDAVPYCVVGGLAVNLHGIPRTTAAVHLADGVSGDACSVAPAT